MDAESLAQFKNRWQAVAKIELEERRATSVEQRWQQLNAIFQLAQDLGLAPDPVDDEQSVYETWATLKKRPE